MSNSKNNGIDSPLSGKKTVSVPKPKQNIGIDTENQFAEDVLAGAELSRLDYSEIEKFTTISRRRDDLFSLIDAMANDSKVQAVLETYAEDATERNDQGQIVWAEAADENVAKYVNFLLDNLNVDKNVYNWVYTLCKYGDVYIRLYRQSDVEDDLFDNYADIPKVNANSGDRTLNEQFAFQAYRKGDNYAHYVEAVPNPAEVFELMKFGKSYAYIQAPINISQSAYFNNEWDNLDKYSLSRYKFRKDDLNVFPSTEFVHASLNDGNNRFPERVDIFRTEADFNSGATTMSYLVKRGQSVLYPAFKVWRQLQLLENSVLLNRLTKSSIARVLQIEVGDMPKEQVKPYMYNLKNMIEQKSAMSTNQSMSEYTNPGPIENNIYLPTRDGQGAISTVEIGGGDTNVRDLADLDYYLNLFYGTLRVPKQFFAQTDDSTGFNGGTSLSVISSRYAKTIKRMQQSIIQMTTDMINLMLIDKGLESYINKFTIKMQAPTTQEDITRRETVSSNIQLVNDIMNVIGDIEDPQQRLRIIKQLFANVSVSPAVLSILQEEIDRLQKEKDDQLKQEAAERAAQDSDVDTQVNIDIPIGTGSEEDEVTESEYEPTVEEPDFVETEPTVDVGGLEATETEGDLSLPSMDSAGINFADNSNF